MVKSKKAFVSVLAVVMSLLITMSVILVAVPTVSAKNESAFTDNECIFIDCRLNDGTYWDKDGAAIRVFTYYNDSDDAHYCHEFEENFANDGWFTGSNVLQKGILADKFCDHVYRFRIPSDKISHVRVVRTNGNSTEKWNITSDYIWNNDKNRVKTGSNKSNCIKITGWGSDDGYSSWQWTSFAPANNASYNSKTANPDSTITGNSELYAIDAKFYDYYNDDEIQKGWGNINNESNHASVHYTKDNSWYWWAGYWEPFSYLNNKIASKGGKYPMYFGNFYGKSDGYTGEGKSNLVNFNNQVNNSNNIGGNTKSVAGLTGGTLDSNGNIVYATDAGYNSSTVVPFFDDSFLSSNKVGSVVNSKFPMRKDVDNGITTYRFDSTGGLDNVWLNDLTSASPTVSYAKNSSRAVDSLYSYSNREANGYGFFPFDGNRSGDVTAKNYGFGMRIDVDFNLGSDSGHLGQIKGTDGTYVDQVFSFTGDDDVWVYVDGKLILDLGGDHKKTTGSINFHTKAVTSNTGATFNNATRNQNNFTLNNESDPTAEHTLTMFYVERGMIESNLSFNFNFAPVSNQLITEKVVNTAELNAGIKDEYAVANADSFTFTSSQLNGKDYTYGHTTANGTRTGAKRTVSNSAFNLGNKDTGTFNDQLTVGTTVNVTESFPNTNVFNYDKTSWIVVDIDDGNSTVAQSAATTAQALNSSFTFKTNQTGAFDPTKLKLTYTNTPKKADVVIKKNVVDSDNVDIADNKTFTATVLLSFDKGTSYNAYPLKYFVTGSSTEQTMSDGQVTLQEGKDITIKDLPVGTYVKVTENAASLDGYTDTTGEVVMQVTASGASTTITNKQPVPGEVTKTIEGTKTLDGQNYTGRLFGFKLDGIGLLDGDVATAKDTSSTHLTVAQNQVTNGKFSFPALTFTEAGVYRYHVYEDLSYLVGRNTYDSDIYQYIDADEGAYAEFLVTITVTKNGTELTASDPVIVPYETTYPDTLSLPGAEPIELDPNPITIDDFDVDSVGAIVFQNKVQKGGIEINKTNQADEKVGSVTFAIYKVDEFFLDEIDGMTDAEKYDEISALSPLDTQTTDSNGRAAFEDLDIYEAGYTRSSLPAYQYYALIETGGNADYNINKTPQIFKFPTYDAQEDMLKYHYTFDYVNGIIRNPYTAGNGMDSLRLAGMFIIGMSLLTLAGFILYRKRNTLSFSKAKHIRNK